MVSYLGFVCNLTLLLQEFKFDLLLKPILEVAGQDISHCFDPNTKDIHKHIDPLTGCMRYCTRRGCFEHIPHSLLCSDWANDFGTPWWKGLNYQVGSLSAQTQNIRIINTLTSQEHILQVGALKSMWEILHRYLLYNVHAASYTWKCKGKNLNMDQTLEENGIRDEEEDFDYLNIDGTLHTSAIPLYFNDDLTEL